MGQCYSTSLHVKVRDGQRVNLVSALGEFTKKMNPPGAKIDKGTLEGLVRTIFSGWERGQYDRKTSPDGWTDIESDFNASYSWECTMQDGFELMAPFLEDGSSLYIETDDCWYTLTVADGKVD